MSLKIWNAMRVTVLVVALCASAAVGLAQDAPEPTEPREVVSAGYDLFTTDPAGTDLLGIPFTGDDSVRPTFDFVPPPDSADGRRAIGDTDTIVHRLEDAVVTEVPGTTDPITIELVLLRLVSTVEFDIEGFDQAPVFVTLQKDREPSGEVRMDFDVPPPEEGEMPPPAGPIEEEVLPGPRSFGQMTITFESMAGGTFDSRLLVFADLRLGGPRGPIVCGETIGLPPCSDLDAGLVLESDDSAWGRDAVPESITIRGINFSLAAPDRDTEVDTSRDFWAGVDPSIGQFVCLAHGGHPDPGGFPTRHNICRTPCTTGAITFTSCRDGKDNDCNGTIDDCDEDQFGPSVTAPQDKTFECAATDPDTDPSATGFAEATDNCFPPTLPRSSLERADFKTDLCGRTFLIDRIWTATDDCGNEASMPDLQQIRVVDKTEPEITCPEPRRILWTDDRSPYSLGKASGTDVCGDVGIGFDDVSIAGVCRSEEVTRTWTATDACGLETPCEQPISVRGPKDAIEDLDATLLGLGLADGLENALSSVLDNGVESVCANRPTPAVNQLEAFINQVMAQSGQAIDAADAIRLRDAARAIIDAVEDPASGGACPEGCGEDDGGDGPGQGGGPGDDPGDDPGGGDACPDSDTRPTVVIDGCDSGVDNLPLDDGCTISDRVLDCAEAAGNHGEFVRCIGELQDALLNAGAISRRDRGAIQRCAGQADLP